MQFQRLTDWWGVFITSCHDPLSALDGTEQRTSITLIKNGVMTGIACTRKNRHAIGPDRRSLLQRFIGAILNLRAYGSVRHPESRYWD